MFRSAAGDERQEAMTLTPKSGWRAIGAIALSAIVLDTAAQQPGGPRAEVVVQAMALLDVPYRYGGSTPAGFDCSGYVMFVYAQFGVSLPHSVSGQAAAGTRISIEDAVPGDLVIMDGHDGFYAGNGNIMDAPDVGRSISIRPIWTSDYYIVRLGI
jgi:cell wall-associated NlpC family hydrolase